MFIQNLLEVYLKPNTNYHLLLPDDMNYQTYFSKKADSNKNFYLLSILTKNKEKKLTQDVQNFANKKLISRNLVTKLINQYWQETIFLSMSNPISDTYINALQSSGIAVYKSQYKKFLLDFSKALNTGRIEVSVSSNQNLPNKASYDKYIKYVWRKGFNFPVPKLLLYNINSLKYIFLAKEHNNNLIQALNNNSFPLFTVVNKFNQIIMAEPAREIVNDTSMLDKIYRYYSQKFLFEQNNQPVYEGMFFINPEDALEYKNYIQNKYKNFSIGNNVEILASKLGFYYQISQKTISKTKFRLIPDLTELGKLLFEYRKLHNISFHKNQKYGKTYFQGQPIYLIQPTTVFDRRINKNIFIEHHYKIKRNHKEHRYQAVFMNYQTALSAWKKFRQENTNYKLPVYPKIIVYNLEDYLNTNINQNKAEHLLFIPSKESFNFIKNSIKYQTNMYQIFSSKWLYLQVLTKRIIWSLTSRQPNVW